MINRRRFLQTVGVSLVAVPRRAGAQPGKVARIGYLALGTAAANVGSRKAFIDGLRDHGWIEGQNVAIESRWAGAGGAGLDASATELARMPLDVIFAVNTPAALAAKRTGTSLPVVFAQVSEPVAIGLVESLAHPGRNFTGLTTINRELMSKRLEILKETLPGLARVGYLANPGYEVHKPQLTEMNAAARGLGLMLHPIEVRSSPEFGGAFARMEAARAGAVIVQQDELFLANRAMVVDLAMKHRLPGMFVFSLYPHAGGFMSYGANGDDLYRRAAEYVHRILRGAKPANLPVERPTKFEFVINLKTAKALGLTIPPSVLLRADQVIE